METKTDVFFNVRYGTNFLFFYTRFMNITTEINNSRNYIIRFVLFVNISVDKFNVNIIILLVYYTITRRFLDIIHCI